MKAYKIVAPDSIDTLRLGRSPDSKLTLPRLTTGTCGPYAIQILPYPLVPNFDSTGEVTSIGDRVTRFKFGDRVMRTIMQN
jgi:NADPH:quinone reductase-like Zn-dependent oxidoreductase